MSLTPIRFGAVLVGIGLALLTAGCQQAQESGSSRPAAPGTTASGTTAATALVDSLDAARRRFRGAQAPTATDTAALRRWADSLQARGNALRSRQPDRARTHLQQARRAYRALADSAAVAAVTSDIGVTHFFQAAYDAATDEFRAALSIDRRLDNRAGVADHLGNVGLVRWRQGRFDRALDQLRASLRIEREIGDRAGVANNLGNVGLIRKEQGAYDDALARLQEALALFRELGDRRSAARILNNLGNVYRSQGRYEDALPRYQEALAIKRAVGDERGTATTLNNLGIVHRKQARYGKALDRYQGSLRIKRQVGDRSGIAVSLNNIGNVHRTRGRYDRALDRYREALRIKRDIGDREGGATTLHNIGDVRRDQGDYEDALDWYRESFRIHRDIGSRPGLVEALASMGTVHLRVGRLAAATDTLERAVDLAESLRRSATSPEARRSLLSTQIEAYRALATAHVRADRPPAALRAVEQARARLLADRLAGTARRDTSFTIPPAAALRAGLGPKEAALLYTGAGGDEPLAALVVTADTTRARVLPDSAVRAGVGAAYPDRLERLVRTEGPLTAALRGGRGPAPSAEAKAAPSLAEVVRLYRHYLVRVERETPVQADLARRLHGLLIEPVDEALRGTTTLTVVPTGALGYLPFEALANSAGRYLVEAAHVRYAQSLTVLRQLRARERPAPERPLLAVGGADYRPSGQNPAGGPLVAEARRGTERVRSAEQAATLLRSAEQRIERGRSPQSVYARLGYARWPNLPETTTEVEQLGRIAGKRATVLTGTRAAEPVIRSMSERGRLRAYRRVHFATHGVAVPEAPELSALVLSQVGASDSVAAADGYLTMDEIAGLDVRTDVAVLSACQTGLGRIVAGEGVVSLSHAFLRAGANATLVSQWKVLDASTRRFMRAVYRRARTDETSFARAVTEAKRAFIVGEHGQANTDPLRWAPFVYYGRE